jgi:hypothetical protein
MKEKTHWKKQFNYDYLGSYSLTPGQDMILTIEKTQKEMVKSNGGKEEQCFVAHFKEDVKPMILNKTNCKVIGKIYTPFVEDWPGKQIQLYTEKVKAFGDEMEALRIRSAKPNTKKPELLPGTQKWNDAIDYLHKGNPIANILKSWDMTEENKELLMNEAI